uniref:uncharacterized protein LOC117717294 n=1 Tax=Arvicanthis niloticus TaxID=61156 RepID=UPI001486B1C9|nr:uncharacterized protein LOC117717294 [Arvicanthis niloticus]
MRLGGCSQHDHTASAFRKLEMKAPSSVAKFGSAWPIPPAFDSEQRVQVRGRAHLPLFVRLRLAQVRVLLRRTSLVSAGQDPARLHLSGFGLVRLGSTHLGAASLVPAPIRLTPPRLRPSAPVPPLWFRPLSVGPARRSPVLPSPSPAACRRRHRRRRHEEAIQPHEAAGQPDRRQASARGAPAGGARGAGRSCSRGAGERGEPGAAGPWAPRGGGVCAKLWLGRCPLSCPEEHRPRETHASLYSSLSPPAGARRLVRKLRKLVCLSAVPGAQLWGWCSQALPADPLLQPSPEKSLLVTRKPRGVRLVWLAQISLAPPLSSVKESRNSLKMQAFGSLLRVLEV